MSIFARSVVVAVFIAVAIESFTIGVLAPQLPREVCRPAVQRTRTESLPKARLLHLSNNDGAVNVITNDGDTIELSADIRAYPDRAMNMDKLSTYLDSLVSIDRIGDIITIIAEPEDRPEGLDLRMDFSLSLPKGMDISIRSMKGNVIIGTGCNRVAVKGNRADIDITDPTGSLIAKTVTGRIVVRNVAVSATLETVYGSIYADVKKGDLTASTTTGTIYATLLTPNFSNCQLTAMNGNIKLLLPDFCSAQLEATTGRGEVTSSLPQTLALETGKHTYRAKLGAGRAKLLLDSLNGDITIARSTS